jgi:PPOX class probable F420-dependent enzyme
MNMTTNHKIPNEYLDLFKKRAFANLATLMPDGTPQVTPVWVDYDGQYVLVNTARGRQKDLNMRARPDVALSIQDPDDPYRYLQIRGRVAEITERGADAHIDKMAKKYTGADHYKNRAPGQVRVIYKILPMNI